LGGDYTWPIYDIDPDYSVDNIEQRLNKRNSHLSMRMGAHSEGLARIMDRVLPDLIRGHPLWDIKISAEERDELQSIFKPYN
jgi:hypothetical protein